MLTYDMPLFRPPSEGANLIIQATLGCSFNRCTFCSMYRGKQYRARPLEAVFQDIDRAARAWPGAHRVFLADGDAFVLPAEDLLAICAAPGCAPRSRRCSASRPTPRRRRFSASRPRSWRRCGRRGCRWSISASNRARPRC